MCGPSSQEETLANLTSSFSGILRSSFSQYFGSQSAILKNLTNIFSPIAAAGPSQQGMSPQELAARNTQAITSVGANYANAARALGTSLSARGGGNEVLPYGGAAALQGQLAAAGAGELSQEELAIQNQNYALGRENFQMATAGLNALAGEYSPTPYSGQALSGGEAAFGEASQVQQEKNQAQAEIAGGIVGLGMDAATFGAGAYAGGFGGGLKALATGGGSLA